MCKPWFLSSVVSSQYTRITVQTKPVATRCFWHVTNQEVSIYHKLLPHTEILNVVQYMQLSIHYGYVHITGHWATVRRVTVLVSNFRQSSNSWNLESICPGELISRSNCTPRAIIHASNYEATTVCKQLLASNCRKSRQWPNFAMRLQCLAKNQNQQP